jgi:hypothetical protein
MTKLDTVLSAFALGTVFGILLSIVWRKIAKEWEEYPAEQNFSDEDNYGMRIE